MKLAIHELLAAPPEGQARRRFADLNRLNLLSLESDESVMVQCMGYKLLREYGLPAPRCNHLRVYVNGEYYGLMQNVEEPDDGRFLTHRFGNNAGMLIEASHGCGFDDHLADLEYLGPSYGDGYDRAYDIARGEIAQADALLIPMLACGDETQTPDDSQFRACIEEWIDLDQWLRTIAAESITPALESFTGARRNYYLYFVPDAAAPQGGRFQTYSWDFDHTLHRVRCEPSDCDLWTAIPSWWSSTGERAKLVQRLLRVYDADYCRILQAYLDDVFLERHVDEMAEVIRPAMVEDPDLPLDVWEAEVATMRDHITDRRLDAQAQIDAMCGL